MKKLNIGIVDYDVGNLSSIHGALVALGYQRIFHTSDPSVLQDMHAIILPGVGAFSECMNNLKARHLDKILGELVFNNRKPLLGICVGMQLFSEYSEEGGVHKGLGWIPGFVRKIKVPLGFAVPHVGWNEVYQVKENKLFTKYQHSPDFYFDHSYHFECEEQYKLAYVNYGAEIVSAVQMDNIYGVQFHPEKSQNSGLKLLRSFFNLAEQC